MSRKRNKLKNIEEANKRLLESFHQPDGTPIGVNHNHMPVVKEDHENSDSGKMEYIKGALKNLNSDDLHKIYLSVEKYDPEYENKNPNLPNTGSQVDDSEEYYNTHDKYGNLNYDSRYSK